MEHKLSNSQDPANRQQSDHRSSGTQLKQKTKTQKSSMSHRPVTQTDSASSRSQLTDTDRKRRRGFDDKSDRVERSDAKKRKLSYSPLPHSRSDKEDTLSHSRSDKEDIRHTGHAKPSVQKSIELTDKPSQKSSSRAESGTSKYQYVKPSGRHDASRSKTPPHTGSKRIRSNDEGYAIKLSSKRQRISEDKYRTTDHPHSSKDKDKDKDKEHYSKSDRIQGTSSGARDYKSSEKTLFRETTRQTKIRDHVPSHYRYRARSPIFNKSNSISFGERRDDRFRFQGRVKTNSTSKVKDCPSECMSLKELEVWTKQNFNKLKQDIKDHHNNYNSLFVTLILKFKWLSSQSKNIKTNEIQNVSQIINWFFTSADLSHISYSDIGSIVHILSYALLAKFYATPARNLQVAMAKKLASMIKASKKFEKLKKYTKMNRDQLLLPKIYISIIQLLRIGNSHVADGGQDHPTIIEKHRNNMMQLLCIILPEVYKHKNSLLDMTSCIECLGSLVFTTNNSLSINDSLITNIIIQALEIYNNILFSTTTTTYRSNDETYLKKPIAKALHAVSLIMQSSRIPQAQKKKIMNAVELIISTNYKFFQRNTEISFTLLSFLSDYYYSLNKDISAGLYSQALSLQSSCVKTSEHLQEAFKKNSFVITDLIKINSVLYSGQTRPEITPSHFNSAHRKIVQVVKKLLDWFKRSPESISIKLMHDMMSLLKLTFLNKSTGTEREMTFDFMEELNKFTSSKLRSISSRTKKDEVLRLFIMSLEGKNYQFPINFKLIKQHHDVLFDGIPSQTILSDKLYFAFIEELLNTTIALGAEITEPLNTTPEAKAAHPMALANKRTLFKTMVDFLYRAALLLFEQRDKIDSTIHTYQHIYLAFCLFKQTGLLDRSRSYDLKALEPALLKKINKTLTAKKPRSSFVQNLDTVIQKTSFKTEIECFLDCFNCKLSPVDYKISYTDSTKQPSIQHIIYLEMQGQTHYVYLKHNEFDFSRQPNIKTRAKRQIWELALHSQQLSSNTIDKKASLSVTPQPSHSLSEAESKTIYKIYFVEVDTYKASGWTDKELRQTQSSQGFEQLLTFLREQASHFYEIKASDAYFKRIKASMDQSSTEKIDKQSSDINDKT